jgi:D-cysteine desulfhydrase family pyridoxal phosphate-dependent enzyme
MSVLSLNDVKERLEKFPRTSLIHTPTPFDKLERLTEFLQGPEIYVKREDMTGLAFGGNKSRKLEYIMPDVLDKKADVIITWGGVQSNWCLQTAAAARRFGIKPILVLYRTSPLPQEFDGNLLLDFVLEADIKIKEAESGKFPSESELEEAMEETRYQVQEWGHTPYIVPVGGSKTGFSMEKPLGALAYVHAYTEMLEQAQALGLEFDYVVHGSGSGSTQAGLAVGAKMLSGKTKVLGVSVLQTKDEYLPLVHEIAREAAAALGYGDGIAEEDIIILDEYIKEGYGIVNRDVAQAIRIMALEEGIFIDPVYVGKAMVALLDLVKKGRFRKEDKVVFMHTGGLPALFPNKHSLGELLSHS